MAKDEKNVARVVIKECDTYQIEQVMEKINSGMDCLGGWDAFVKPGMTVLLKVNLIGPKTSDTAAITHSEFVRAITRILKARSGIAPVEPLPGRHRQLKASWFRGWSR